MRVELELGMSRVGIEAMVRDLRRHGWNETATQIEAQLPKPPPPEPSGDVVVKDRNGALWRRDSGEDWWAWDGNHSRSARWVYLAEAYQPLTVYRPEGGPS